MNRTGSTLTACLLISLLSGAVCLAAADASGDAEALVKQLDGISIYECLPFIENQDVPLSVLIGKEAESALSHSFVTVMMGKLKIERAEKQGLQFSETAYGELLAVWYSRLEQSRSYDAILLRDVLKRSFLEYAVARLAGGEQGASDADVLNEMALSANDLYALQEPSAIVRTDGGSLREASSAVWASFGYTNVVDGYVGLGDILRMQGNHQAMATTSLMSDPNNVLLALRILNTEQLRVCGYNLMSKFLSKGGDLDQVSVTNASSFYQVLPLKECAQIRFDALAKHRVGPGDILLLLGRLGRQADGPVWMESVFK